MKKFNYIVSKIKKNNFKKKFNVCVLGVKFIKRIVPI